MDYPHHSPAPGADAHAARLRRLRAASGMHHLRCRLELDLAHALGGGGARLTLRPAPHAPGHYRLQHAGADLPDDLAARRREVAGAREHAVRDGADLLLADTPDGACDSLVALGVFGRGADWRATLRAWRRVLRDGGRMAFDLASLDHLRFAQGRPLTQLEAQAAGGELHLAAAELADHAAGLGLAVAAIVPYGAFLGDDDLHPLAAARSASRFHWWRRILSWIPDDPDLYRLALLLEQQVVGRLATAAAPRCMVVLERRAAPGAASAFMAADARLTQAATLPNVVALDAAAPELRAEISRLVLRGPRHLRYYTALQAAFTAFGFGLDLFSLLDADARACAADAVRREDADRLAMAMIDGWQAAPALRDITTVDDVPLAGITDYHLIHTLLIFEMHMFPDFRL